MLSRAAAASRAEVSTVSIAVTCATSTAAMSVFFAPARYKVVKIALSYFKVVLQTTKHTIFYLGSGPSLEVIALRLAISY
jgi:hypothetical protein